MNVVLRRRLEMAERVRDFLRAHPARGLDGITRDSLEALIERMDAAGLRQRASVVALRSSTARRRGVRRLLERTLLRYLADVAVVAEQQMTGLAVQFRVPRHRVPDVSFITLVRIALERANAHQDLLRAASFSQELLSATAEALREFERTLDESRAAQREQVGATADLWDAGHEMCRVLRVLDGLVAFQAPELLAVWTSIRKVTRAGKSRPEAGVEAKPEVVKLEIVRRVA
ncbi:MAG: hypothetical protein ABR537_02840 [Gemmatimonadales bacterium]